MKLLTLLISTGLVFTAAGQSTSQDTNNTGAKKSDTKKVTKVPEPFTIPKDATPLPDGSFRYVDKDGKKWIYRATPFGVSKSEERPVPVAQQPAEDPTSSEDVGDAVRFTRPTPFGPKVWTSKKTELSAYEKGIFDRDLQRSGHVPQPATKTADVHSTGTAKQD